MDKRVVTFGEIMLRLSTQGFQRFAQARCFDAIYGGAEANVAVVLSNLGVPVDFVTALPPNDLGQVCINYIRQFGVGTGKIIMRGERLGIYFAETGASQRGNKVIYDRANSAFATIEPGAIDWGRIFSDACWFHWTGITPAVSESAAKACLDGVKKAEEMGLSVSCDLNYRAKLWRWGKTAQEVMSELVEHSDIVICNEEDAEKVFGIRAPGADVTKGVVEAESYRYVAEQMMKKFPKLRIVAITLRGSISASHNRWEGVLYDGKDFYRSPSYDITHIVDRVGAGDSFAGGLIYGLLTYGSDLQKALNFAAAISCLKHTIPGDSCIVSRDEVEGLMGGVTSGRISR